MHPDATKLRAQARGKETCPSKLVLRCPPASRPNYLRLVLELALAGRASEKIPRLARLGLFFSWSEVEAGVFYDVVLSALVLLFGALTAGTVGVALSSGTRIGNSMGVAVS